jgi:hypothetical protein
MKKNLPNKSAKQRANLRTKRAVRRHGDHSKQLRKS